MDIRLILFQDMYYIIILHQNIYINTSHQYQISYKKPKIIQPTNLSPASSTIFTVSLPNTGTLVWMNRKRNLEYRTGCKNQLIQFKHSHESSRRLHLEFIQMCFFIMQKISHYLITFKKKERLRLYYLHNYYIIQSEEYFLLLSFYIYMQIF